MKKIILSIIFFPIAALALCQKGELCQLNIPGAQCANGSQSYINYIDRGSSNLFVYVQGGGACFDAVTCGCRLKDKDCKGSNEGGEGATAGYLSRPPMDAQNHPWGEKMDGPIGEGNYFEIVYCTGDVFTGAGTFNYGNAILPRMVRHVGAVNFQLSIDKAKELFPDVKKVTVIGSSAGGVGITYNLHHIVRNFGATDLSIVNDSGIPILAKFLDAKKVQDVLTKWKVEASLPTDFPKDDLIDFEDIYQYNSAKFDNLKFGLLGATQDAVFQAYFALLGGSSDAVEKSLVSTAAVLNRTAQQKYFITPGRWHTATFLSSWGMPKEMLPTLQGISVDEWIKSMVENSSDWNSLGLN